MSSLFLFCQIVLLLAFLWTTTALPLQKNAATPVNATTFEGKFLFGYQGFFRRPGQGNDHWSIVDNQTFGPSAPECLFTSNFILPNGANASLFESNCTGVVDKHFQWMQENNIDGVLVQRFYDDINDASFLQSLGQVRTSAEKYGRAFAVEYDLSQVSSFNFGDTVSTLLNDYSTNIAPLMSSSAYLQHQGRPALEPWGFGTNKSQITAADCYSMFHALRSANPNPYVIMGVQQAWRSEASSNPDYYNVYTQADVIQPWTVGSYDHSNYPGFYTATTVPDKADYPLDVVRETAG